MPVLAPGLSWIDLNFRGRPHVIATAVVSSTGGVALIDPGPTSCVSALEQGLAALGLSLADVSHILLTHVHLDHAGATGVLVRRYPRLKVFVHERGAPHLIDPTKLIRSATRLYGDEMETLWGEIASVPRGNLAVLDMEGGPIAVAGRQFHVAYTPGHAMHHVSFFDASSGVAFVGDVAGVRMHGSYVRPPTPPPDIDIESWAASVDRVDSWRPSTLFLTHFGPSHDVSTHLCALVENLRASAEWVRQSLLEPGTDAEKARQYAHYVELELRRNLADDQILPHRAGAPFEVSWHGLARYWRKRGA